jgi:hypothetical protein
MRTNTVQIEMADYVRRCRSFSLSTPLFLSPPDHEA